MSVPSFTDPPFACPPPTDMELFRAYERLGNVWKVGELFGMKGSTVHHRIKRTGLYKPRDPEFTEAQVERIKSFYATTPDAEFDLSVLAAELGKSRQNICRKARHLGLSKKRRPVTAKEIERRKKLTWAGREHPRGMAGKKHSPEALAVMSQSAKRMWATHKAFEIGLMSPESRAARSIRQRIAINNRPASKSYTRTKGGHREDLGGIYFRSSWEANYARYLNLLVRMKVVQSWEFEPETFWFEGVKRGAVSYKPDFKVHYRGDVNPEYVEIKGWEVAKDRTKWRRMKKYHPHVKLVIVGAKEYRAIERKWSAAIPTWEKPPKSVRDILKRIEAAE